MDHPIGDLARYAGISKRTLRYYDEIGLLKPRSTTCSGYRLYGQEEVNRLQQILFYRELDFSLEAIRVILDDPRFDRIQALEEHMQSLLKKQRDIATLIWTVKQSLQEARGEKSMSDEKKFEGFKKELIEKNEQAYGEEIRAKYGDEKVDGSQAKLMRMSEESFAEFDLLGKQIVEKLVEAEKTKDPGCDLAQQVARMHKQWLLYTWPNYTKEAHENLAQMYVDDPRFGEHYQGRAAFLRDAILIFTGKTAKES
ncbi:MAG: MerR family transcriptional regulator [Sphaerochaeta sp.]|nr:MerR family transcriptional regulator [Sphaerochaeta sp.]